MILQNLWLLLLPVAAASGWIAASRKPKQTSSKLPEDYLVGLNFLLNEEPDKAIDIFIQMLKVDTETIETHLALGNLFRRRGEVDRAIRIHQNLIARPNLPKSHRMAAMFALALDYLNAGVLDQAEKLFLQLERLSDDPSYSYKHLLSIYQQEKEWDKAIAIAKKLAKYQKDPLEPTIAHYYCELAKQHIKIDESAKAVRLLRKALNTNENCTRANLLLGDIYIRNQKYKQAIRILKQIEFQNLHLFGRAIEPLAFAYRQLHQEQALVDYLQDLLKRHPEVPVVLVLSEAIRESQGDKLATKFMADYVRQYPSLEGVQRLLELHLLNAKGDVKTDLSILKALTDDLLAKQTRYQCAHCGFQSNTLYWQCPSCQKWETVK